MFGIFHWTPEGELLGKGFNLYWTRHHGNAWWIRLVIMGFGRKVYLRFRSWLSPHIIFNYSMGWDMKGKWVVQKRHRDS